MFARILFGVFLAIQACAQQDQLAALYAEAQQATAAGDQARAAAKYEQIVKLAPTMAEAFANLGNAYYWLAKTEQAANAFRQAIRLKPQLTGPHFLLGVMAFNQHSYEAAAGHLAAAEKLEPANLLVQAYLGYTDYARMRYAEAAKHLQLAASEPGNADVLYQLSKAYGQLARQSYNAVHTRFRDSLYDHLAQGHAHEAAHEWDAALESYQKALKLAPGNVPLRHRIERVTAKISSTAYTAPAGNDELVDGSLAVLEAAPSGEKLQAMYQQLLRANTAFVARPSAESTYRAAEGFQSLAYLTSVRVLEETPESHRAHQLKGESLEAAGSNDEAIAEYHKAIEANPELPGLHFTIANIYWKTNRLAEAAPELRKELQIDPRNAQALYELGDVLADAGQNDDAERCFTQALQLHPNLPEAHLGLDKIYSARSDYQKSLLHLRAAAKLDPLNGTPHYRMAALYRKMGMQQDAKAELEIFERLKPAAQKAQ